MEIKILLALLIVESAGGRNLMIAGLLESVRDGCWMRESGCWMHRNPQEVSIWQ